MSKFVFKMLLITFTFLILSGCYRIEVQQGNILTPREVSAIHQGMSEPEVFSILGAPVLQNIFVDNRKTYIYTMKAGLKKMDRRYLVIHFFNGRVAAIETNVTSDIPLDKPQ